MQNILLEYSWHYNRDEMKMESILTMCLFSLSHITSQLAGNRHIYTSSSHRRAGAFLSVWSQFWLSQLEEVGCTLSI